MNKPVNLGFSILELSKMLIHEFWYIIQNQNIKIKLRYMDADSFIVHIKTEDICKEAQCFY